ncbi:MAG: gliding motility-associated C-terminal domain-containing protein, partial [Bacteroidia bacterium]|nr:gliding motility-associated C-terminal domain-containing protein [Bacteroidia bacterium]
YRVYRRLPGSQTFTLIAELTDPTLRSYTDVLPPGAGPVCYQLSVQDNCGIEQFTPEHCLMDLEAQEQDFRGILSWSAYTGWTPVGYEVWRTGPDSSEVLIATTGASPTVWIDLRLPETQPTICYRIKAIPPDGVCGTESWSPQRCIALEPIVFLPNAFTPNGDNVNDVFRASAVFAQTFEMVIYNRWGREVFRTSDPVGGWDGTARGQAQPEGVYLCRINWTDRLGARFERAGSVTLIR